MAKHLDIGSVAFEAEGRLLQELGERLVANPDIALVELLKNAYDADAPSCSVQLATDGAALIISDDGSGMTKDQFLGRWMKIATAHKMDEPVSPLFGRRRTGQKGIGRFAVRFLGSQLQLTTISDDPLLKRRTKLTAVFDWALLDAAENLRDVQIKYVVDPVDRDVATGTSLRIEKLRHELGFLGSRSFRTSVLRIVSPLESLERGRFQRAEAGDFQVDPGYRVVLPSSDGPEETDIGKEVLDRAWARLRISVNKSKVEYIVDLAGKEKRLRLTLKSSIRAGLVADIRHFPRRQGVFSGGSVDGRAAWAWVRENCGVAIVDHGFRLRPFGFAKNDWLHLDHDNVHNERDWRSEVAKANFPIPQQVRAKPGDNPALNLPNNFQLVGAVFVESQAGGDGGDLTVAMDREGFLENEAFSDLVEIVRGGVEFLALVDKQHIAKVEQHKADAAANRARKDFKAAIAKIRQSPTLSSGDKNRLVAHYAGLSEQLEQVEHYSREARRKLETMGLLGVVAGFMTHEAAKILDGLERSLGRLRKLSGRDKELNESIQDVEHGYAAFKEHVEYTSLFVDSMHRQVSTPFKARAQVDLILKRFGSFARDRGLECGNEVSKDAIVTGIPVAAYSGVLLNLYTNAIKAVLAKEGGAEPPQVVFRGWNEGNTHVVEVLDRGIGVPPELRERIFDPLFTTTSSVSNPLGSGMGLGLSLVKEVVEHSGGKLRMIDPPARFSTCFRIQFRGAR